MVVRHPLRSPLTEERCQNADAVFVGDGQSQANQVNRSSGDNNIKNPVQTSIVPFPNLETITLALPNLSTAFSNVPLVRDLFQLAESHSSLTRLVTILPQLEMHGCSRLLDLLSNHPRLNTFEMNEANGGSRSSEYYQATIWACRRIQTVSLSTLDVDDSYEDDNPSGGMDWSLVPSEYPTVPFPESLRIQHRKANEFFLYLPVLRMCSHLKELTLSSGDISEYATGIAKVLHETCPLLTRLTFTQEGNRDAFSFSWALSLLQAPQDSIVDRKTTANTSGFRLESFELQSSNIDRWTLDKSPRLWTSLVYHHGPTLCRLDLRPIVMLLEEFADLVSQLPSLIHLLGSTIWKTTISVEDRSRIRNHGDHMVVDLGLHPWACTGLRSLKLSLCTYRVEEGMEIRGQGLEDGALVQYLVGEFRQLAQLQSLDLQLNGLSTEYASPDVIIDQLSIRADLSTTFRNKT